MGLKLLGINKENAVVPPRFRCWRNKKGRGEFAPTFSCRSSHQCQYIRGQKQKATSAIANIPWDTHQRRLCNIDSHRLCSFQVRGVKTRGLQRRAYQYAHLEIAARVTISSRDPRPEASRWKKTSYTSSQAPTLRSCRRRPFRLIRRRPLVRVADGPHRPRKTVMGSARNACRRDLLDVSFTPPRGSPGPRHLFRSPATEACAPPRLDQGKQATCHCPAN